MFTMATAIRRSRSHSGGDQGGSDPGPRNVERDRQNPDLLAAPDTDSGTVSGSRRGRAGNWPSFDASSPIWPGSVPGAPSDRATAEQTGLGLDTARM